MAHFLVIFSRDNDGVPFSLTLDSRNADPKTARVVISCNDLLPAIPNYKQTDFKEFFAQTFVSSTRNITIGFGPNGPYLYQLRLESLMLDDVPVTDASSLSIQYPLGRNAEHTLDFIELGIEFDLKVKRIED